MRRSTPVSWPLRCARPLRRYRSRRVSPPRFRWWWTGAARCISTALPAISGCALSMTRTAHGFTSRSAATLRHPFRAVAPESAVACVLRLLEALAAKAPDGRMRDVVLRGGLNVLRAAVADLIVEGPNPG